MSERSQAHRAQNQEANGLDMILLFFMPVSVAVLIGIIWYLGAIL